MKSINLFLKPLFFQSLFFLCSFKTPGYIPKEDQIVLETINKTGESIKKKYNIDPIGYGMRGKFDFIEISFQSYQQITKDEARELVIDCVREFQNQVNSNELLKPFFKKYPVTFETVGICIYFRNINGKDFKDPNISVAKSHSKGLDFKTNDPENEYEYKEWYEETHEEALALVEKTKQSSGK